MWMDPKPCWHCQWFGYLMAENRHGQCQKPSNVPMITIPAGGCAFWEREAGVDDCPRPEPLRAGSPARAAFDRERARLMEIREKAEAEVRRRRLLPDGFYVEVGFRDGTVVLSGGRVDRTADRAALEDQVARLGVNAAIRAGRL